MKTRMPAGLSLGIGIFCISLFPILVKWTDASGTILAFYRMFFAFICLIPIAILTKNYRLPNKNSLIFVILSGILFALDIAIWNASIKLSNPTQSTVIGNLAPLWIGVILFLFTQNKPRKEFWLGALFALFGLLIFIGKEVLLNMSFDKGFILALISSLLYALYMLASKKALQHTNIIQFMTYNMLVASLSLIIIILFLKVPLIAYPKNTWGIFIINALVCQLLGWISINHAIQKLPAQRVSLSLLSQIIVTGFMAYVFLNETINNRMLLGALIIIFGIAYTFMPERNKNYRKIKKHRL